MIGREYMAGFFDGEGCINITVRGKSRQVSLRVMIVNTDSTILTEIQAEFGGRLARPRVYKLGWKAFRQLTFSGRQAYEFVLSIRPYLRIKARQADLAIRFWQFQHADDRNEIRLGLGKAHRVRKPETIDAELAFKQQMHQLNAKGLAN